MSEAQYTRAIPWPTISQSVVGKRPQRSRAKPKRYEPTRGCGLVDGVESEALKRLKRSLSITIGWSRAGNKCFIASCKSDRDIEEVLLDVGFTPAVFAIRPDKESAACQARIPLNHAQTLKDLGLMK